MTLADDIRTYIEKNVVEPARAAGQTRLSIRAGDLVEAMGLQSRVPSVCSALRGKKLRDQSGLELVATSGPKDGLNAHFQFRIARERRVDHVQTKRRSRPPKEMTESELRDRRAALVGVLNQVDSQWSRDETAGRKLGRLVGMGQIPKEIGRCMSLVLEFRNAVDYRSRRLSAADRSALEGSWEVICEWAEEQHFFIRS